MEDRLIANSVLSVENYFDGSPCWEWIGQRNSRGYPYMSIRRAGIPYPCKAMAHRVSVETFHGPMAPGDVGMHKCNNTNCISPLHVVSGTQSENMRQCLAEGRHNSQQQDEEPAEAWHKEW